MQLDTFTANHIEAALIAAGDGAEYALKLFNLARDKQRSEQAKLYGLPSDTFARDVATYGAD